MLDRIAKLIRGHLKDRTPDERKAELKQLLLLVASGKDIEVLPKRSNRLGRPVDCPYGIFKTTADCARFIYQNRKEDFFNKYPGIPVSAYTEKAAALPDNNEEKHYTYCAIVQLCRSKKYPDWNFLERRIKVVD